MFQRSVSESAPSLIRSWNLCHISRRWACSGKALKGPCVSTILVDTSFLLVSHVLPVSRLTRRGPVPDHIRRLSGDHSLFVYHGGYRLQLSIVHVLSHRLGFGWAGSVVMLGLLFFFGLGLWIFFRYELFYLWHVYDYGLSSSWFHQFVVEVRDASGHFV